MQKKKQANAHLSYYNTTQRCFKYIKMYVKLWINNDIRDSDIYPGTVVVVFSEENIMADQTFPIF